MRLVSDAFRDVIGLPCWKVERGHGSFVTLEFGQPHLQLHEPVALSSLVGDECLRIPQRAAYVRGDWHLWVYCCDWFLRWEQRLLACSESPDLEIDRALHVLNGQRLGRVDIDPTDARTTFTFELGFVLGTQPYALGDPEPHEQWLLYQPSGQVLSVRSDGRARCREGTAVETPEDWHPLRIEDRAE